MRLILIRHGDADYQNDCLSELGRAQAEACAERLLREDIQEIYSSPKGRAQETASYTARRLGLPVTVLDFMQEIKWRVPELPENGYPWTLSNRLIAEEDYDYFQQDWRRHTYFEDRPATMSSDRIPAQIDAFLSGLGYRHEKRRFFCSGDTKKTVALFSHGGSGRCVLAHLLGLPFPYVFGTTVCDNTSVSIVKFPDVPDHYVAPRLQLLNDTSHLRPAPDGTLRPCAETK